MMSAWPRIHCAIYTTRFFIYKFRQNKIEILFRNVFGILVSKFKHKLATEADERGVSPVEIVEIVSNYVDSCHGFTSRSFDRCIQRWTKLFKLFLERSEPLAIDLQRPVSPLWLVN
ncbi:Protein of unknown function [Cotesia congregata]|uniref:Uncharacterized protein n=1 Tax=Cotesia congregata TaxID=51543 RepID=A0A8J2HMH9_COTCN|nr:Protein of unknown function [Cotesia congregata]